MASSSHHYSNNYQSFKDKVSSRTPKQNLDEEEEEEEGNHKEWLKLKLGVGGIGSGSSSSKIVVHEEEEEEESSKEEEARSGCSVGLGLGLGLGPKMKKEKEGVTLEWSRRLFIGKEGSWKKDYSQHWMDMGIPEQENADSHHCSTNLPHLSGLWFTLHSSTNRKGEALPQIPKAYIRVKNENMTIFMVKKYLVTKLGLSNESEVDILCMGERLLDSQSLRHVRDSIWMPALLHSLNSTSKSIQHSPHIFNTNLLPLIYQKYLFFTNSLN